jgi:hypothetical protein
MPRFRPTARLIVLDPAGRVLLLSAQDPRGRLWFTYFGADAYFLVRVREPSVDTSRREPLERSYITGYRWWTAGEIRVSGERVFPVELDMLMDRLIRDGVPGSGFRPVRLAWDA